MESLISSSESTLRKYFPAVLLCLEAEWILLENWLPQFLIGHRRFRAKLHRQGMDINPLCLSCGIPEVRLLRKTRPLPQRERFASADPGDNQLKKEDSPFPQDRRKEEESNNRMAIICPKVVSSIQMLRLISEYCKTHIVLMPLYDGNKENKYNFIFSDRRY